MLKVMLDRANSVLMKQILLVDDEPNFLDALQRYFRPYRQEWTLTTASNGNEAMALVLKHPFDVVIINRPESSCIGPVIPSIPGDCLRAGRADTFETINTDILMPEKEGLETISELRKGYPWIRIIAISGGGRQVGKDMLLSARYLGAHRTLEKPFDLQTLVNALRALLTTQPNADQPCLNRLA